MRVAYGSVVYFRNHVWTYVVRHFTCDLGFSAYVVLMWHYFCGDVDMRIFILPRWLCRNCVFGDAALSTFCRASDVPCLTFSLVTWIKSFACTETVVIWLFKKTGKQCFSVLFTLLALKQTTQFYTKFTLNMSSNYQGRQHLSYDVCLEVRGKIIRTVLFCIVYWSCAQS